MTNLPSFDEYASSRTEQDHPAGIFVVINKIEQDDVDAIDKSSKKDLKESKKNR